MDFDNMTKEDLVAFIKNLNEDQSGKLGLVWDRETVPEEIVVECNKKMPILNSVEEKNIITDTEKSWKNNLLIEGDNFHSLSVLSYTHKEAIDVIYIDPPYNTGREDFVYNDRFVNEEDSYRHSKWLNFMDKRLKIAKRLLKPDGVIMISIDDNEFAQLSMLCDKIFLPKNKLSTHHIQVRYADKTLNETNDWQPVMEYVLIYAKDKSKFKANNPIEDYSIDKFVFEIEELTDGVEFEVNGRKATVFKPGEWKITEHENPSREYLKATWVSGSIYSGTGHGTMVKRIVEPRLKIDGRGCLYRVEGIGDDGLGYRYYTNPTKSNTKRCKMYTGMPAAVRTEEMMSGSAMKAKSIPNFYDYSADFGNIRHEGGVPFNSGKKPVKMLKELINYHPNKNALVLDFFAGSGSTGHAVLDLNHEDGGKRQFILCTNNEVSSDREKEFIKKYGLNNEKLHEYKKKDNSKWLKFLEKNGICTTVTYQRMKNVIEGYSNKSGLGGNLRYFKTDFVSLKGSRDQLYYDLTEKCVPMLCVKENTHILVEQNEEYAIFSNEEHDKYVCVYFDVFGCNYDEFIQKMEKIEEHKSLYIFTLGNQINMNELVDVTDYTVEPIPYEILELYKRIVELSREV